jgi:hypothetical protein
MPVYLPFESPIVPVHSLFGGTYDMLHGCLFVGEHVAAPFRRTFPNIASAFTLKPVFLRGSQPHCRHAQGLAVHLRGRRYKLAASTHAPCAERSVPSRSAFSMRLWRLAMCWSCAAHRAAAPRSSSTSAARADSCRADRSAVWQRHSNSFATSSRIPVKSGPTDARKTCPISR